MENREYILENLGCANCAAKMEEKINALPQVQRAVITFATKKLSVTAEDPDALLPQLQKIVHSIEPEVQIRTHSEHHHDHTHSCDCGHCHNAPRSLSEGTVLLLGAGLFLIGLLLSAFDSKLSLLPYVGAYLLLGLPVLQKAGKTLVKGHVLDENFLMSIATLGAFAIGEAPEAAGIMLFYRIGEFFEEKAVSRSRSQIMEAVDLRPETVTLADGSILAASEAKVGDLLLVRPGDRIGLDSVVVSGESRIDTAPITGEPVPVGVGPGDPVTSGCINTSGQLTVRVEKPLSQSMVTRILNAVETAAAGKPKIDRFITRFARIYTPVVVTVAAVTAIVPSVLTGNWSYWIYTALSFLVMSCPCALVLSVPLAFFSGIGVGSKKGILFKGGLSMEALAEVKAVALDKTGTLTKGDFRVQSGDDPLLQLCASCEQHSNHPIALSITAAAKERGLSLTELETLEELPGHGVRATLKGKTVLCGNARLMERFGVDLPEVNGTVLVAANGQYLGSISLGDTVKEDAAEAVAALKKLSVTPVMLTGDSPENARLTADALGISSVHARLLPQDKLEKMQLIRQQLGAAMFVGDGINDAPVLAGADVGAAMGSGADAAIEAADVVFMTGQVQAIPESIRIARQTRKIARQNVIFALAIKLLVMVLGLLGHASMWLAVFADSGVAMLCVLNSIRSLYTKR